MLPGRLFIMSNSSDDPLMGLIAVDPNTATWSKITTERDPFVRASPDGKRAVLRTLGEKRETRVYDAQGERDPVVVFDECGIMCSWLPESRDILVSAFVPPLNSPRFETWWVSLNGSKKVKLLPPDMEQVCDCSADGQ